MTDEGLLMVEGKGRGARYRRNKSRIMTNDQVAFFQNKIKTESELFQTISIRDVDVSLLGLSKEELTPSEEICVEELLNELVDAWFFLRLLKMIILNRKLTGKSIDLTSIPRESLFKELLDRPIEQLELGDKRLSQLDLQNKIFEARDEIGFLVSPALKTSKEFWQRIENPILAFFEQVKNLSTQSGYSKYEELAELIFHIVRGCLSNLPGAYFIGLMPIRELTESERAVISELPPLMKRYGREGISIILETCVALKGETFAKTGYVVKQDVVQEKLTQLLSKKGVLKKYATSNFGQDYN
jgi:hypothetical protein